MNEILLQLASKAISDSLLQEQSIPKSKLIQKYPKLQTTQASFVTLNLHGKLRGCIGSLIAHRPLIDDIIHNAKAAAFEDPRFEPLSQEEFLQTKIEISLLSKPTLVQYENINELQRKITPQKDGVILKYQDKQATFLPQVWEQLNSFELFFDHLCQKAGLQKGCLQNHPEIYCYRVEKIT